MSDEEVERWLTPDEQRWLAVSSDLDATMFFARKLASARRELVMLEWKGDSERCPSCRVDGTEGPHREHCVYATLPRA